jgi:hypothetical protein
MVLNCPAMSQTSDASMRHRELKTQLGYDANYERVRATVDYWFAVGLMILALASSFVAALLGFSGTNPHIVGGIALVPGTAALLATTLKFEAKSHWHYRKLYALQALSDRLEFEMPQEITFEHISAISKERRELISSLNEEWEKSLSLSWSNPKPH